MFPSSTLLSLLILAVSTANASPIQRDPAIVTLSIASRISTIGAKTLGDLDRARATALRNAGLSKRNLNGKRAGDPVSATNTAVTYTASIGVGSPATQCMSSTK